MTEWHADPREWLKARLAEHGPDALNDDLAQAAAAAILNRADDVAALKALDELTDFERELATAAYEAGAAAAQKEVRDAVGPTAATIDARALLEIMRFGPDRRPLTFRTLLPFDYLQGDPRAASIVVLARHRLKAVEAASAPEERL